MSQPQIRKIIDSALHRLKTVPNVRNIAHELKTLPLTQLKELYGVCLTPTELVILNLFHTIYMGLKVVSGLEEEDLCRMLSSDFYSAYHYVVTGVLGSVTYGVIFDAIRKLTEKLMTDA